MTGRDRDRFRKYKSGHDKKKIKQKKDLFLKSQHGSIDRFLKDHTNNKVTF